MIMRIGTFVIFLIIMVIISFSLGLLVGFMVKDKEDKQQKIMKKIFYVIGLFAMMTVAMSSCGNKTADASDADSTVVDSAVVDTVAVDSIAVADSVVAE